MRGAGIVGSIRAPLRAQGVPLTRPLIEVRHLSSSSSSSSRIRHTHAHSIGLRSSSRPTLQSSPLFRNQRIPLATRSFSILPSSLTPTLPEVIEESHTVSATDDTLTPVSTIFDPIIDPLSNFLLEINHPLGYGVSIICITLLVRTVFTLPVSLWQRKRALKTKQIVEPELKIVNERLAKFIAREYRQQGKGYKEYLLEVRRQVAKAQSALHKKHSTHPFVTTWAPLLLHIPIFVTLSLTFRRTLEIPNSPFFNEGFLWLDHLGDVDPYLVLPFVGSCLAFGNAELVGMKRTQQAIKADQVDTDRIRDQVNREDVLPASRPRSQPQKDGPKPAPSGLFSHKHVPSTQKSVPSSNPTRKISTSSTLDLAQRPRPPSAPQNGTNPLVDVPNSEVPVPFSPARQQEIRRGFLAGVLRLSAVGFGLIASQMPAGVTLYWVTSIAFSLAQNVVLSWWPQYKANRERARLEAEMAAR
ncbi:hypothetical protein I302_104185 [Kwoniella bestiolae CBS 10118]|uniref:Membrane insertase YidC/Oxa/ALB C-terminal domain-containing protein n=1 Tax=Kwoniella bestiolae CBS 10118 TaxID=1296100 RepID=A0A1B9GAJ2_9TREE|nr:hypothetical protein I302_02893 [Kwoniella bestiolae CBS 10118]OCF28042.1 hypothetical protein I302_02893 [Kwoniella bestiolae CBS 10118]